jgi:tRNA pseudouridine38-40 synthase
MCESKQFKLLIAYDGTDFSGWQVQKNGTSVANYIERVFKAIFKTEIRLIGASRTDAGVHAFGQVATFFTQLSLSSKVIERALQEAMPASIVIRSCQQVEPSFHPRFDVTQKTYHYTLYLQPPMPWQARFGYFHDSSLDIELFKKALELFKGTHDFRSFCTGNEYESTVRTIDSIELLQGSSQGAIVVIFRAKGFLRYMIRRILGACLQVASGKFTYDELITALAQQNPNQRFVSAPAHGLMLYEIQYTRFPG